MASLTMMLTIADPMASHASFACVLFAFNDHHHGVNKLLQAPRPGQRHSTGMWAMPSLSDRTKHGQLYDRHCSLSDDAFSVTASGFLWTRE